MTDETSPGGLPRGEAINPSSSHTAIATQNPVAVHDSTPDTLPDPPATPARKPGGGTPVGRIVGIDVARGLAVLGMYAAHLAAAPGLRWSDPSTWAGLVNGRSSILFATLAGLSIGIMTAGRPRRSVPLLQARMRIVVRAVLILLIGVALELFGTPIAVILGVYALLFLAMLPFVAWSVRRLVALTLGSALVGVSIYFFLLPAITPAAPYSDVTNAVIGGIYPAMLWFTFFAAGLTVSRLRLGSLRTQVTVLVTGAALCVGGHLAYMAAAHYVGSGTGGVAGTTVSTGAASATVSTDGTGGPTPINPSNVPADATCTSYPGGFITCLPAGTPAESTAPEYSVTGAIRNMVVEEPHSGSPFEIIGSGGFALGVIGLCLLACRVRALRALLWPIGAVGSMALTAYCAHIVVIAATGTVTEPDFTAWFFFAGGALVLCSLWKAFLGRGPLERLLAFAARKATELEPPSPPAAPDAVPAGTAPHTGQQTTLPG